MRRSVRLANKEANMEKEAQREPKAKKSRSNDKIPNIAAMDNGTMVETFKFLNYHQLATNSFVSKRFWNLIRTHRHKLALIYVDGIYMYGYVANKDPAFIEMFNTELSAKEYNKWIVRNGYSKEVPFEGQIAKKKNARERNDRAIYEFWAWTNVSQKPNHCQNICKNIQTVFSAHVELKDKNWPLFQHFIRLLLDPLICIDILTLDVTQMEVLNLLTEAIKPNRGRLQCKELRIEIKGDNQKLIVWKKDHVRCDEFQISLAYSNPNYDAVLLDLFMTGANCTSAIDVTEYDLSIVIVNFVQKFIGLKSHDEYQLVESTQGHVDDRGIVEALKRNCAEFIADEEQYEEHGDAKHVIGFSNNDIQKKLTLNFEYCTYGFGSSFSIEIKDL